MKINVHDIEEVEKDLVYEEPTADLSAELRHGDVVDFEFPSSSRVELHFHRTGDDLFFRGHATSVPIGHCARCLGTYAFTLESDFDVVLVPASQAGDRDDADAAELGVYEGDEVDLTPLVREQLVLALPTRPLCREDCQGLCPECGANRNETRCRCTGAPADLRLAVLHQLRSTR